MKQITIPSVLALLFAVVSLVVSPAALAQSAGGKPIRIIVPYPAGGGIVIKVAHAFELLCAEIRQATLDEKPMQEDALVRDRIALLAAEIEVGRQLMLHCAELARSGPTPPEYGAISKVFSGELMERFGEAALELLGMRAALSQGAAGNIANGKFEQGLRHSLMWVISIGTNEIQRSLIAQRGLGLPR